MSNMYQSLSHSKWDCKYHVVFVPKYRKKAIFGEIRQHLLTRQLLPMQTLMLQILHFPAIEAFQAAFPFIAESIGAIFHELARQKECRIVEGHLMRDHVDVCIEIPPKHAVSSVIGFIKGKSALAIARQFGGKQRNFNGENFWARGYAVSTVGFEEEAVRRYIREQEGNDQSGRF